MSVDSHSWFLADDFSGVLEVGAIWKKSGIHVDVVFESKIRGDRDAFIGFSSETRNSSLEEARNRITSILRNTVDCRLRFKKIDSTLRGPVGAELDSISRFFPGRPVLFTPANARVGRTVENGRLLVDGVPISETAFANDPVWPITEDCIQKIISITGGCSSGLISLDVKKCSEVEIREKLKTQWKKSQILIVDSRTEEELEQWVKAALDVAPGFLGCGSGGLAKAMDSAGALADLKPDSQIGHSKHANVLFVVGSLHPRSRDQVKYLADMTGLAIEYISPDGHWDQDWMRMDFVNGALVLATQPSEEESGLKIENVHRYSERLADIASQLCKDGRVDTMFVTGGETARAVLDRLEGVRLELEDEFQPGVSVSTLKSNSAQTTRFLVKPGGFGDRELLAQILSSYGNH